MTKFMFGTNKLSCPRNKDIIMWEKWEMGEENGRKNERKKKCDDHMKEK
jgi:hypothetical protein